jgi:hypothetical protein
VRVAGWVVSVRADGFTGRVACDLHKPRIEYRRSALVIRLGRHLNTADIAYRIDGGPPIWTRSDEMELARLGFALGGDSLTNPSGGLVRIPARRLQAARVVAIQPRPWKAPIQFDVAGLGPALDAATKAGCGPNSFD